MRRQGRGVHIPQHELAELEQLGAMRIGRMVDNIEHGLRMKKLRAEHERRTQDMDPIKALALLLGAGRDGSMVAHSNGETTLTPSMNVFQDPERFVIQVPLPGVLGEDIKLDVEEINGEQHLHVKAVHRDPYEKKIAASDPASPKEFRRAGEPARVGYVVREYPHGNLDRCLGLPTDVNPDKITSSYENGMLTVTLPRETQKSIVKPTRSIDIKRG